MSVVKNLPAVLALAVLGGCTAPEPVPVFDPLDLVVDGEWRFEDDGASGSASDGSVAAPARLRRTRLAAAPKGRSSCRLSPL